MTRVRPAPGFDGWRDAARALLAAGAAPETVEWVRDGDEQPSLGFDAEAPALDPTLSHGSETSRGRGTSAERGASIDSRPSGASGGPVGSAETADRAPSPASTARVPRRFLELARTVACHRDDARWALLYRVLWRLGHGEPRLMEVATDADVHRLLRMEKAVRRSSHKMKAFVRFRRVEHEGGEHFVAWFEPEHDVLRHTAPFFAERFAAMRWSILTPDGCAHWDGAALSFTAPVPASAAPAGDALEAAWRTYYASTFNPARVRVKAMRAEMPAKYWKNLPEAELIAPLLRDAPARVRRMIEHDAAARAREADGGGARKQAFRSPAEKRAARDADRG